MEPPEITQTPVASYFDSYWKNRFSEASYRRRINSLRLNYTKILADCRSDVLEIGPGFGEMLEILRDLGVANVQAIDNDAQLTEALRARGLHGVQCVEDAIAYCNARPSQFRCVIALHVLEHFAADAGMQLVRAVSRSLVPGGKFILEVPNMANFITAPYARWADHTHRNGFTRESLAAALTAAGFEDVRTFGIRRPLRSLAEAAAWCGQSASEAIVWTLLKLNYPQARIVAAPAIGAVGHVPFRG